MANLKVLIAAAVAALFLTAGVASAQVKNPSASGQYLTSTDANGNYKPSKSVSNPSSSGQYLNTASKGNYKTSSKSASNPSAAGQYVH